MNLMSSIIRCGLIVLACLGSHAAMAGPVRCSVNNQDSSCIGHITTAWQTPPTCPNIAGYTTVASARWIGSGYSAPQCNFQAAPTCPASYTQTQAPGWNGSSWSAPGCAPPTPPPPPPPPGGGGIVDPVASCSADFPAAIAQGTMTSVQGYNGEQAMPYPATLNQYVPQYPGDRIYSWTATGAACPGQFSRGGIACFVNGSGQVDAIVGLFSSSLCHPH
jgi:hypothetical protein